METDKTTQISAPPSEAGKYQTPPKGFRPEPYAWGEELTLDIEDLTNLGVGIARHNGWVIHIPYTIPSEKIRAAISHNYANYSVARLRSILEASPHRITAKCALFGSCGGCQYQHIKYPQQLFYKQKQLQELLEKHAGITLPVEPPIASPKIWEYRSKLTPHFQKPDKRHPFSIGFLQQGSRQKIIDVPQCPLAQPEINKALTLERKRIQDTANSYKKGATLLLRSSQGRVFTEPNTIVSENVGDLVFSFLARDFFQNNPSILPDFTRYVAEQSSQRKAPYLIDAYCGSGLFSLTGAEKFQEVMGIELSESSADWARENARANGISNAHFVTGSAEEIFHNVPFKGAECALIIDPPRKGCSPSFLKQLREFQPQTLVYVSCNPATQIRDLEEILKDKMYSLEKIQPFDLFPQTRHLECVMTFQHQ